MASPEPPRRGQLPSVVSEPNVARAPHTPLPAAPTAPPPAMAMRPPKHLAEPRARLGSLRDGERTLVGLGAPPPRPKLDSREVATETLLAELAERATAEREARAEADALRAELDASKRAQQAADSLVPGAERKALIRLAYKLGTPLVVLMGAATAWLSAHTAKVEEKVDRVEETRKLDKVVTDPLTEKVQTNERDATGCKAWAAATDDYYRQVFGKLGVSIPQQPGAKPVTPIETRAPLRKSHVSGGTVLEVVTPPPPLP